MKKEWAIREAEAEDAEALQQVMDAAYSTYQARMGGARLPPMDVDYSAEIRDFPVWVAESEDGVVGGMILVFEEGCVSLANVAVHPGFQGQGLGGGLIKYAENVAQSRGISKMRLATHVLLEENLSLYKHLGWSVAGRDDVRVYLEKNI